jgi:hypothetical protein
MTCWIGHGFHRWMRWRVVDLPPLVIRPYITCPDCGRSAPDVDGRCADCHDAKRLRDAVAEWARADEAVADDEYGSTPGIRRRTERTPKKGLPHAVT